MGAYAFMNLSKKAFRMRRSSKLVSVLGISEKWGEKIVFSENLTHIPHITWEVGGVYCLGCWSCSSFKDDAFMKLENRRVFTQVKPYDKRRLWKLHFQICKLCFFCAHAEAWEIKQFWAEETQKKAILFRLHYTKHIVLVPCSSKIRGHKNRT